jgi:restriction system protein
VREQLQRREQAAAVQAHNRAVREEARLRREYERELAAAQRLQARTTAESIRAHKALQVATAQMKTAQAADVLDQIDSILSATLDVDDYVDIDALKQSAQHPPFPRDDLKTPIPEPSLKQAPPEPLFKAPPPPAGLSKMFGKQKHAQETARAHAEWAEQHKQWHEYAHRTVPLANAKLLEEHAAAEQKRAKQLEAARAAYKSDCDERERIVAETNEKLETFKRSLEAGDPDAIREYVGIVLGNSAYPEAFQVDYEFEFDAELGELTVTVIIPAPSDVPNVKSYRYIAKTDEITETLCSQKEQRDRYNGAVAAVAIRTFHEVFESDRRERIQTISLLVQTETANPATGLNDAFPFVAAAADRQEFLRYELRNVNPAETLAHMRSSVSKNAHGLKPVSTASGIR